MKDCGIESLATKFAPNLKNNQCSQEMKKVPIGRNEVVFLTKLEFLRKFRTSKTRKSSYFYEDRQRQSEGLWDRKLGYKVCAKLKKQS